MSTTTHVWSTAALVCGLTLGLMADETLPVRHPGVGAEGAAPMAAPVPGPMPEDKVLPSVGAAKAQEKMNAFALDPQTQEDQKELADIEATLKKGGLTDKQRFDLQLRQTELKKKLTQPATPPAKK